MYKLYVNLGILFILFAVISVYCIHIKMIYPKWVIQLFAEPLGLFIIYISIYLVSFYNELIALLMLVGVLFIHLDVINLAKSK